MGDEVLEPGRYPGGPQVVGFGVVRVDVDEVQALEHAAVCCHVQLPVPMLMAFRSVSVLSDSMPLTRLRPLLR
jgi:hypothetical protein